MTKEDRVSLLLEVYEQEKERLNKEFQRRYCEILISFELDEMTAPIEELNDWKTNEKAAIERRFKKAIIALEG